MTYRVEYNGGDLEVMSLDAAIEAAKNAIVDDVGAVTGWTIEHDEVINDWFIQGVRDDAPVGSTAIVAGPEPVPGSEGLPEFRQDVRGDQPDLHYPRHAGPPPDDDSLRSVSFTGITPTEVFGKATTWLAGRAEGVEVGDVAWQVTADTRDPFQLRLYYRAG